GRRDSVWLSEGLVRPPSRAGNPVRPPCGADFVRPHVVPTSSDACAKLKDLVASFDFFCPGYGARWAWPGPAGTRATSPERAPAPSPGRLQEADRELRTPRCAARSRRVRGSRDAARTRTAY